MKWKNLNRSAMKENIKDKILFVCLDEKFGEEVSRAFADSLNLHFANCKELIEYDLFNSGAVLSQCGEDYYLMREKKVIESTCSYEESVMFSNYDIYSHNKEIFSKYSTKIYLNLPKKLLSNDETINKLDFDMRDKVLKYESDFIINSKKKVDATLNEIYKILRGIQ